MVEIVASSIFIILLAIILIQCNLCFGRDSRDMLDKPVDVTEGKSDGVVGAVETVADQFGRATNLEV